ncbi:metal ABC transporter substrate-binding protein [Paenibacillus guangzhouensis]|uniref:metal ABC transporter substrate-binding protein n=1 Tax=Paenibacillus guangzhouensis TaxID=1473112 RepID=UPI0012669228|nr:zinc ABC transporter substrate-binding protein [Paenibacillus guangzhouensis]
MKSMRKYKIGAIFMILAIMLAACGQNNAMQLEEGKVNVVTTIFPIYDFARQIGGDHAHVMNLIPTGVEPHDWTPKSQDITVTSKAQLLLYNGAGLEGWIPNFLQGLDKNAKLKTVEVSHGIDLIHAEGDDGHHHGEEAGHEDEHNHDNEAAHGEDMYLDPHTWVSPKSALIMAKNIKDSFIAIDAANQADYEANYTKLEQKLKDLDAKFETELAKTTKKEIVVSHQAFGYLARDYGLTQKSVMGLSPEAEPRSQDILELTKYVKEHDVKYIFFEELVSDQIAKMLASEAKVGTLVLNPIEGLTPEQDKSGESYVTLMERNLQNLVQALQ